MKRAVPLQQEMEKAYNVRLLRDDAEAVLQDWSNRSEQFRLNADSSLDCGYGLGPKDRLDVFRGGDSDAPLYLFIHGGYWQRGDKSVYSFVAEPFVQANVNVALIGYELCPGATMTDIPGSIQRAVTWLWNNAESYGVSSERINLSGHSAGGHLTAMALATDWATLDADIPHDVIKTGIPISGLYQLEPLRRTTISDVLGLDDEETRRLSPFFHKPTSSAPILLTVGGAETGQFHWQTDQLIESWSSTDIIIGKHIEPDVDHFDILNQLADSNSEIFNYILGWLK